MAECQTYVGDLGLLATLGQQNVLRLQVPMDALQGTSPTLSVLHKNQREGPSMLLL